MTDALTDLATTLLLFVSLACFAACWIADVCRVFREHFDHKGE